MAPQPDAHTANTRPPLTRERVLRAAMELADRDGIEALTMRRLGQELGVEAMTLYYHVGRKDALLGAIVDLAYGEIEPPDPALAWRTGLRRSAISAHDVLLRHPWATRVTGGGPDVIGPGRVRYMEGLLARLRSAGFSAEMTHHAYHALDCHIVGYTLWEAGYDILADELPDLARSALRQLSAGGYPALTEHIEWHLAPSTGGGTSEFEFGLDLILDGLERILEGR
jgi:AcrR family transcriptional regulator